MNGIKNFIFNIISKEVGSWKKYALFSMGMLVFQMANSQENYISGYVIKNNGDTLSGFLDYRNWDNNPERIKFKANDGALLIFLPADIKAFAIANEAYLSGIIQTEVSTNETNLLNFETQFNIQADTAFLQTLVAGKKSLYLYKTSEGKENFYVKNDTGFELLLYKKYLKAQGDKRAIRENKQYVSQLMTYLSDCSSVHSKLKNTLYKPGSLVALFQHYYDCMGTDMSFIKKSEKANFDFGVLTGISLTTLEFRSSFHPYLVHAGFQQSLRPSAGAFFELILAKNQRKWSFYNEILITSYKVNGSYFDYKNQDVFSNHSPEIGYVQANINNLIRYKYPIRRSFLFLNAGISNAFSIRETNYNKVESKFFGTEKVEEILALNDTRKHEIGLTVGAGIKYNQFSCEVRYKNGNGMSSYPVLNSTTETYYLLLGYKF